MNYGFFRVAAAAPRLRVADPDYNAGQLETVIDRAVAQQVRLLVTPELSVTGYTCADLFFTAALQQAADRAVQRLAAYTAGKGIAVLIGAPVPYKNSLYNCALLLRDGQVQGMVPKVHLANYNEFYEKRWFASGADFDTVQMVNGVPMGSQLFDLGSGVLLGVELCEDLWVPQPPSGALALQGANLIANLSASDEYVSKAAYRRDLVAGQSARCVAGYVYAGAGVHESTTDLVFSGATLVAENGGILAEGERFARESVLTVADVDVEKLNAQRRQNMSFENRPGAAVQSCPVPNAENDLAYRIVDPHPFVPAADAQRRERCKEIFLLQASGLAGRLEHVGSKGCVLGISGGLDSTLALLVAVRAMELLGKPASAVLGVTMPGFGTTDRTYRNALDLMEALGVTRREISIADACVQHMADIGHDPSVHDITYENTQARERTQILFDLANKEGCLLVGTGDL
ncbi:MAG: NAD(+) synthase, partial [Clostridium sp.]|nr:NAD(+) synthase [Clostridium sp.]